MKFNSHILDFILERARARECEFGTAIPVDCENSKAIFDELDSLNRNELTPICEIYLLGCGESSTQNHAIEKAEEIGYGAVELIAFDVKLSKVLNYGRKKIQCHKVITKES